MAHSNRRSQRSHKPGKPAQEHPLLAHLQRAGIQLSDKARQAIEFAIQDADLHFYDRIYDDSLLTGLIRAQGTATHLLASNGIDLSELIRRLHEPVPDDRVRAASWDQFYLAQGGDYRKRRLRRKVYGAQDLLPLKIPSPSSLHAGQEFEAVDLLLQVMDMPIVWHHLRETGLSINKIKRHIKLLDMIEPDIEQQKFVLAHDGKKFRVSAVDLIDVSQTPSEEESSRESRLFIVTQHLFSPRTAKLDAEIEEFEWLINRDDISEYDFQVFFQQHPDFLLGIEHRKLHSQLVLTNDKGADLRPDFFLERIDGSLSDILDLKLPASRLVVGRESRRAFSASLSSVLGQLRTYRSYFDDSINRRRFYDRYGLRAYKPSVVAVIGRSQEFRSPIEREDLLQELPNLKLLTYDDLLLRARRRRELILNV